MCLLLCHQPSLFILKLLILFFSVVTVAKLCPSPHVPPRLLPSGKDFIFTEKLRFLRFASPWICVSTVTCVPDPALTPAPRVLDRADVPTSVLQGPPRGPLQWSPQGPPQWSPQGSLPLLCFCSSPWAGFSLPSL